MDPDIQKDTISHRPAPDHREGAGTEREALIEGFSDPSHADFGNVPFWWWDGDDLERGRITDQLETLSEQGVEAVCFEMKYPEGPPEGPRQSYFSEEWWEMMDHAASECDRLEMDLWIHDETYHHSPPSWKRYWQDTVEEEIDERPELQGHVLDREAVDVSGGETAELDPREDFTPLSVAAYPRADDGTLDTEGAIELDHEGGAVEWTAPEGNWHVASIGYRPEGLCRTTRDAVDRVIEHHYEAYVERLGEYLGESIVGTFQDELFMLQGTIPCDDRLLARYEADWGEDPTEDLVALFEDCGADTGAIRSRYHDVVTTMLEENWFEPLYEWHERRGLKFAHDNWGREDLTEHHSEYGDYMRTMRWFQEPGYDDGGRFEGIGTRTFFDAKVASSIAENYGRDRVWGELFHTTGWGFPPRLQYAGIAENVCYGLNRFNKHGLYYTTLGGWYEHAPPDTHFRQPYWEHADAFNDAVTRLMYLFSQGDRVVDAAMHYPITTMQAERRAAAHEKKEGPGARYPVEMSDEGEAIDARTREVAEAFYESVSDLLLVDHETIVDGGVVDGDLAVGGGETPVFVLGPATTIRREVVEAAAELVAEGGVVVSVGRLPDETVEGGAGDPALENSLDAIFGDARPPADGDPVVDHESGGAGVVADDVADLDEVLDDFVNRDVKAPDDVFHAHRRVGRQDVYLVLNTRDEARTVEASFRADGRPERWDLESGTAEPIHEFDAEGTHTDLTFDFAPHEFAVVVFDGHADPGVGVTDTDLGGVTAVETDEQGTTVRGLAAESGEYEATAVADGTEVTATASVDVPDPVDVSEDWAFSLEPTLDNTYADFRYPDTEPQIGPEVRAFAYRLEDSDEDGVEEEWYTGPIEGWDNALVDYGAHFWRRADVPADADVRTPDEDDEGWALYEFSLDVGKPGTHPDDHGHNGVVSDDFLVSPAGDGVTHFWSAAVSEDAQTVTCHHGAGIQSLRVDGEPVAVPDEAGSVELDVPEGTVPIHIVVEPDTETHVALEPAPPTAHVMNMDHVPRVRWFFETGALRFEPRPWRDDVAWFAFALPPGTTSFLLPTRGPTRAWVDGVEHATPSGRVELDAPATTATTVVVRTELLDGYNRGAAWETPVPLTVEEGRVDAGDWRELGLDSFSGIAEYRRTVEVPDTDDGDRVVLDLGDVAVTAEVAVDGETVDTVFSRPFEVDVTDAVDPGENEVTVRVANTVANHFATETPTRYVYEGQTASGLRGPVELRVEKEVELRTD